MANLLSYALTSVADVKESLGIPSSDTTKDNLIIRKINQATEMIEKFCGRRFKMSTYTNEEYDGTGIDQIILKNRPVDNTTDPPQVVSLGLRDTALNQDDWSSVEGEHFFIDKEAGILNLLYTASGRWNRYRVTYRAGYDPIPSDLAEACATLATYYVLNASNATAVKRKKEGLREIEFFDPNGNSTSGVNSLFDQLGIDEILNSYANHPVR